MPLQVCARYLTAIVLSVASFCTAAVSDPAWTTKSQCGLTFQVPSDWICSDAPDGINFYYIGEKYKPSAMFACYRIRTSPDNLRTAYHSETKKEVKVAGEPATEARINTNGIEEIVIIGDKRGEDEQTLLVLASSATGEFTKHEPTLRKIIASLKRTEITPPEDTTAPSYKTFNPQTYRGTLGSLVLPWSAETYLTLLKDGNEKLGQHLVFSDSGKDVSLPVGRYKIVNYSIRSTLKNGVKFAVVGPQTTGRMVDIKEGTNINIPSAERFAKMMETGATGTITAPRDCDLELVLTLVEKGKPSDFIVINSKGPSVEIPAGEYMLASYSMSVDGKEQGKWILETGAGLKAPVMKIKPGDTINLKLSEPIVASVTATLNGDQATISLKMVGADGNRCMIRPVTEEDNLPGFEMQKSGTKVMSGKFQYG